jgi:hypothetical protein
MLHKLGCRGGPTGESRFFDGPFGTAEDAAPKLVRQNAVKLAGCFIGHAR